MQHIVSIVLSLSKQGGLINLALRCSLEQDLLIGSTHTKSLHEHVGGVNSVYNNCLKHCDCRYPEIGVPLTTV
jgi:hypothetical protein